MGCSQSGATAEVTGPQAGAQSPKDVLEAVQKNDASRLRAALLACPKGINFKDDDGQTLLHSAAIQDSDDSGQCLEALLERPGIDMNAVSTKLGWTAMHHCASLGHAKGMRILLMSSAKHDIMGKDGQMPIHLAAANGYAACLEALVGVGVATGQANTVGQTALHLVAAAGHESCIRALLVAKPVPALGAQDQAGRTPLHEAADADHLMVLQALLDAGADKKIKDAAGMTPGRLANAKGHNRCAVALGAAAREEDVAKLKATNLSNSNDNSNEMPSQSATSSAPKAEVEGLNPAGSIMFTRVQGLMDTTWKDATTRDRNFKAVPRFEVVQVLRNVNQAKWKRYCEKRDQLALHYARQLDNIKTVTPEWDSDQGEPRRKDVNEFFLFHGTNPEGAQKICENDFRLDLSGSNKGSLYGSGIYFAESSSKSDEYAGDDEEGLYRGLYAMLLCRVCLGNPVISTEVSPDVDKLVKELESDTHHSILGDREAAKGTFREFIVRDAAQAFPAYAIIYRRAYS